MNLHTPNRAALLEKWDKVLKETAHIRTFTTNAELAWIADYATWCARFLEIGSWRGRSAKVALMANPALKITCLDTWDDDGTFEEFKHNLGPEIESGRVAFIRGSSQETIHDAYKLWEPSLGFDGCFIDGGHEEHLVIEDVKNTMTMMKPGSLMAGHDFSSNGGPNDVARGVLSFGRAVIRPMDSIWGMQL